MPAGEIRIYRHESCYLSLIDQDMFRLDTPNLDIDITMLSLSFSPENMAAGRCPTWVNKLKFNDKMGHILSPFIDRL